MLKYPWEGSISLTLALALLGTLGLGGCGDLVPAPLAPKYAAIIPATAQDNRLLVVFTYGFGCAADGRGNGLRDMAETVHQRFPAARVITRAWNDDDDIVMKIEMHRGPVVLVGHSFGGCRSIEITEQLHRGVDGLILLDPVPFHDWAIRHAGKYFDLPLQTRSAVCYYRPEAIWPVSYPLAHPTRTWENRPRELGHSAFCDNVEVLNNILMVCAREQARI
jgi:pimeloyl-ACP methyl ester carboxylesterase